MSANLFGNRFCFMSFGESHGAAMGVVIDGCPAQIPFDQKILIKSLQRRKPGNTSEQTKINSARNEQDAPQILSGVYEGLTLGTPLAMIVNNQDMRSEDYKNIKQEPRPGHADDVWARKFGHVDHRGGGRSSGRETISRVMAGAVAQMVVKKLYPECQVVGFSAQIGPFILSPKDKKNMIIDTDFIDQFTARFPSQDHLKLQELLLDAKKEGQSYGGVGEILIINPPANLGQPVFHKFKSDLAQGMMSIGAASGIEIGAGFSAVETDGTTFHDINNSSKERYGGIRGGITTGEPISIKLAFKPTSSISDVARKGRHDPCIIPRAIPVAEAMAWIILADHILWQKTDRLNT